MSGCDVPDTLESAMIVAAAEANERVRTCHTRVPCPKCGAPVGARCRRMPLGYSSGHAFRLTAQPARVVGPHRERWTLVQPAR